MHLFGCFFGCFLRWKPARCLFVIRAVGPRLGGEVGPLGHSLVLGLWKESLEMKWCRVGGGERAILFFHMHLWVQHFISWRLPLW